MPANIEIKARISNFQEIKALIEQNTPITPLVLEQEDTFFNTPSGRLKLRQQSVIDGQLIYYERADQMGPKLSEYYIYRTSEPDALRYVLTESLGVRGVVRKRRMVYTIGNVRIHLDNVEGLGNFLELEIVLDEGVQRETGVRQAESWISKLAIHQDDLIESAYIDLIVETE
ncbi:MAG: class IV adenylate cyclase [Chloroflexota bacterium]|nr:class IV adenylate cyclase [Chloroflexota bacterium]